MNVSVNVPKNLNVPTRASHARSPETLSGVGHAFLRFFFYLVLVGYNVRDMSSDTQLLKYRRRLVTN